MAEISADASRSEIRESPRNTICFFVFGILSLFYDTLTITAAEDVLSGSEIPTAAVSIAMAASVLGLKITAPWFLQKFSYMLKICLSVLLLFVGLIVFVSAPNVHSRLLGIMVMESGISLGEITFLAMTASYQEVTVIALVAGIGVAYLLGPFYYAGLTTWLCIASRTTISTTIPWLLLVLITYYILEKKEIDSITKEDAGVEYKQLPSSEKTPLDEAPTSPEHGLSWKEKFSVARQILPYVNFSFLTYFAAYLSTQSIITTLTFSNSSFTPRDHYQYYIICYQVGEFLGRSHIFLLSCTCSKVVPYVRVEETWIFAVVEIAHLMFFIFATWFRFVPHVSIVLIFCATGGFVAGSMYVNSAHTVFKVFPDPKQREFALGLLTIGNDVGQLTAGLVGLHVEPQLKIHCVYDLELDDHCITRHRTEAGWATNTQCSSTAL